MEQLRLEVEVCDIQTYGFKRVHHPCNITNQPTNQTNHPTIHAISLYHWHQANSKQPLNHCSLGKSQAPFAGRKQTHPSRCAALRPQMGLRGSPMEQETCYKNTTWNKRQNDQMKKPKQKHYVKIGMGCRGAHQSSLLNKKEIT